MSQHDLGYDLYKRQIVQELKETDFARWKDFCEQFLYLQLLEDTEHFFSDEANFKSNGCVNKQNMLHWLADNQRLENRSFDWKKWSFFWSKTTTDKKMGEKNRIEGIH